MVLNKKVIRYAGNAALLGFVLVRVCVTHPGMRHSSANDLARSQVSPSSPIFNGFFAI